MKLTALIFSLLISIDPSLHSNVDPQLFLALNNILFEDGDARLNGLRGLMNIVGDNEKSIATTLIENEFMDLLLDSFHNTEWTLNEKWLFISIVNKLLKTDEENLAPKLVEKGLFADMVRGLGDTKTLRASMSALTQLARYTKFSDILDLELISRLVCLGENPKMAQIYEDLAYLIHQIVFLATEKSESKSLTPLVPLLLKILPTDSKGISSFHFSVSSIVQLISFDDGLIDLLLKEDFINALLSRRLLKILNTEYYSTHLYKIRREVSITNVLDIFNSLATKRPDIITSTPKMEKVFILATLFFQERPLLHFKKDAAVLLSTLLSCNRAFSQSLLRDLGFLTILRREVLTAKTHEQNTGLVGIIINLIFEAEYEQFEKDLILHRGILLIENYLRIGWDETLLKHCLWFVKLLYARHAVFTEDANLKEAIKRFSRSSIERAQEFLNEAVIDPQIIPFFSE